VKGEGARKARVAISSGQYPSDEKGRCSVEVVLS
jgi:hypothetical protein